MKTEIQKLSDKELLALKAEVTEELRLRKTAKVKTKKPTYRKEQECCC